MNRPIAQYGNIMIPSDNLAYIRGHGQYNELPNLDQTINRGPAYSNALNVYYNELKKNNPEDLIVKTTELNERHNPVNKKFYKDPNIKENIGASIGDLMGYDRHISSYKNAWDSPETLMDSYRSTHNTVGSSIHPEKLGSWNRPDFKNSQGFSQYEVWALKSLNTTPSALLNFFFSEDNVNYLLDKMVSEVYRIRGIQIQKQSIDELLIIMRNKYMYALTGWLPMNAKELQNVYKYGTVQNPNGLAYNSNIEGCTNLEFQIKQLNKSVLEECIKQILSGIDAYQKYYADASSLPVPLSRSVYTSMKGADVLQPNIAFESGHEASRAIASYNQRFNII